jgi:hypothetical protein
VIAVAPKLASSGIFVFAIAKDVLPLPIADEDDSLKASDKLFGHCYSFLNAQFAAIPIRKIPSRRS